MDDDEVMRLLGSAKGLDQLLIENLKRKLDQENADNEHCQEREYGVLHTLSDWHQDLPFLSLLTIWWRLRCLEQAGVIMVDRTDGHTWYWCNETKLASYFTPKLKN